MPDVIGEGVHDLWWYRIVGPHVRDILASLEVISAAALLADEAVAESLVATAAQHLRTTVNKFASDPMPAIAAIREQFSGPD